jgi:hypothetical protein
MVCKYRCSGYTVGVVCFTLWEVPTNVFNCGIYFIGSGQDPIMSYCEHCGLYSFSQHLKNSGPWYLLICFFINIMNVSWNTSSNPVIKHLIASSWLPDNLRCIFLRFTPVTPYLLSSVAPLLLATKCNECVLTQYSVLCTHNVM